MTIKNELQDDKLVDYYYTDSMVTLGYIHNDIKRFRTFVANRAKRIRDFTQKEQWRYVPSEDNPADLATKGISLKDVDTVEKWFRGPEFLYKTDYCYEATVVQLPEDDPEIKIAVHVHKTILEETIMSVLDILEERISSWSRWKRIIALVFLFKKKCMEKAVKSGQLQRKPADKVEHPDLTINSTINKGIHVTRPSANIALYERSGKVDNATATGMYVQKTAVSTQSRRSERLAKKGSLKSAEKSSASKVLLNSKPNKKQPCIVCMRSYTERMMCASCQSQVTLSTDEIMNAETVLIKMIQEKYLANHITAIREERDPGKAISKLNAFIDKKGVLRIGGRLKHCSIPELRHPCILPKKSIATRVIIQWYHNKINHLGRTTTTNELRSNGFWVIGVTSQVTKVLSDCFRCRRYRGKLSTQQMADLPESRMMMEGPFTYCGMDIFGPFRVKERRSEVKRYCLCFTCFSSRGIHLEMVDTLSTDSFILGLRRFTAHRGPVRYIRSDNGTNFVGAENMYVQAMKSIDEERIRQFLLTKDCDWESPTYEKNTPEASHMGGVWERMIRSTRSILTALIDQHGTRLNDEALRTFFSEAAAIINSRPIAVDTLTDPDIEPLTPNHLLTMKTKVVMPPPGNFIKEDLYCQKRWRAIQFLSNEFWRRWSQEYLSSLQKRQKWMKETRNFAVNDIVLVKEKDLPRNKWVLGRITEILPSQDELVRSVRVYTSRTKSERTRPITKLVLLAAVEEGNSQC